MKQTPLKKRILGAIALVLTFAIGLSACNLNNNNSSTTPETTPTLIPAVTTPAETTATPITTTPPEVTTEPDTPVNPPEHVCVFSDWEIVKEPTTSQNGLRERRCECGEVEQEVIEASNTEYYIQYRNLKSAAYPEETGYNSKDGLLNLPQPEAVGYTFVGWYTASIGGELVDYIPEGSTKNYILYAHWELISYEITYKNVPNNTNVTSYDIEDKVRLETPKWSGLVFTHWSDNNGNTYLPEENITFMPEKMSGDLVLTANWKVLRNVATPASADATLYQAFSGEDGFLYFYYDLGTIEHVVLDNIHPDMYYKYEGLPLNLTLSKTVSISEEKAESTARTISQSVSSTASFSSSNNWAFENSRTKDWGGSASIKIGKDSHLVNGTIGGHYGQSNTSSSSFGFATGIDISSGSSSSSSNTVSSSLSYKKEITSEVTENISINADLPSGYYAYVHAGNIRVIAIVFYEVATGNFYLNTYSILDNMHSMIMYYADVNQLNNPSVEGLDFTIPKEEILNFIDNSYYVVYDANGGTGTMEPTLHSIDGTERLAENKFTKEKSLFAGWELTTASGVKILLDGQSVTNLGKAKEVVVLKALWERDSIPDPDTIFSATTKSGTLSSSPKITYTATIEYRNRTADSVEIRIVWKSTIGRGYYNVYGQNFNFSVDSAKSGNVQVAKFNAWGSAASSDRTATGTSGWVKVSLNTTSATTLNVKVYYWQTNSNNVDMYKYDGTSCVNTTWTINIPAY